MSTQTERDAFQVTAEEAQRARIRRRFELGVLDDTDVTESVTTTDNKRQCPPEGT